MIDLGSHAETEYVVTLGHLIFLNLKIFIFFIVFHRSHDLEHSVLEDLGPSLKAKQEMNVGKET